jgi:D-glycerate 3-kinase
MNASDNVTERARMRAQRDPAWLSVACGPALDALSGLLPFYLPLAQHISEVQAAKAAPLIVAIQGPQGAGKTTLAALLERVLVDVAELTVASLSIDDLYLTRSERQELALRVHPLFLTRGVPGTHDVELGVRVLSALAAPGRTAIPRFDKARDDRLPEQAWPQIEGPCDVVLFEGLWLGLPALDDDALHTPYNQLEAREDPHGSWRGYANHALRTLYPALFAPCDLLVHFAVPDFACVRRWRSQAEHDLRARLASAGADSARLMDDTALARFFEHYERFTAHAMAELPARADVVLQLDRAHHVVRSTLEK